MLLTQTRFGALLHMWALFIAVFPIEPLILKEHLFVFVRGFGKNVLVIGRARDPSMMHGPVQPLPDP